MLAKIKSTAVAGIDGYIVEIETDLSSGLTVFDMVGLPDSAVKESRERVRTAIKNSGFPFPFKRITVNLAPADTRKEGPSFDLPIALGILECSEAVSPGAFREYAVTGELSLDGSLRPVAGVLPMAYRALKDGIEKFIVPYDNREEAALVEGLSVYPVKSLPELIGAINNGGMEKLLYKREPFPQETGPESMLDFSDVKGQESVKRALEIAAAGMHNILMIGPPGSGKTMLAKRLPTILPELSFEESIEITKIYSVAGLLKDKGALITKRPFRSPHHTLSTSAMTGGGRVPKPGEVSLAHNGVLFLDELPEFARFTLEVMRQPLEDKEVTISRVNGKLTYPSSFMLVAAMNPCPCGYFGQGDRCRCTSNEIRRYMKKISGPLLDRIDITIEAAPVDYEKLQNRRPGETSSEIKKRVLAAQSIQRERYRGHNILFNSQLGPALVEKYCVPDEAGSRMLKLAFERLNLSARAYHKILKMARTAADLDGKEQIGTDHLAEVIQYRSIDRKYMA